MTLASLSERLGDYADGLSADDPAELIREAVVALDKLAPAVREARTLLWTMANSFEREQISSLAMRNRIHNAADALERAENSQSDA